MHEPVTVVPESLDLVDLGDRLRGQLRLATDEVALRRLWRSGVAAVVLLFLGTLLESPLWMTAAYLGGFLLLVITAWSLVAVVQVPLPLELGEHHFALGDDTMKLVDIDRADGSTGPLKLVVVLQNGTRHTWLPSPNHHEAEDIAWLAELLETRAATASKAAT